MKISYPQWYDEWSNFYILLNRIIKRLKYPRCLIQLYISYEVKLKSISRKRYFITFSILSLLDYKSKYRSGETWGEDNRNMPIKIN